MNKEYILERVDELSEEVGIEMPSGVADIAYEVLGYYESKVCQTCDSCKHCNTMKVLGMDIPLKCAFHITCSLSPHFESQWRQK